VGRHTWQSWRERFRKNRERLDKRVLQIVEEKQILRGVEHIPAFDPPKRQRKKAKLVHPEPELEPEHEPAPEPHFDLAADDDDDDFEGQFEIDMSGATLSPTPDVSGRGPTPLIEMPNSPIVGPAPRTPSPGADSATPTKVLSQAPSLSDIAATMIGAGGALNESQGWSIRIGNDPPPRWAPGKRKFDAIDEAKVEEHPAVLSVFPPVSSSVSSLSLAGIVPSI
jgi:hypothetical protein